MRALRAVMVPHPPLILPQIGRGAEKGVGATVSAYKEAARFILEDEPETIVILTPHSVMYGIWFHISPGADARGDFIRQGAPELRMRVRYDEEYIDALCSLTRKRHFPAGTEGVKDAALDYGTMIPLCFLQEAYRAANTPMPPIVRIGLSCLPLSEHYKLGILLRKTAEKLRRRVSVIASGNLSHRLDENSSFGFHTEGQRYDARVMDVMKRGAFDELLDFSDDFCEAAGECGHRAFTIMSGYFDGEQILTKPLSYEAPYGVGYGVCLFEGDKKDVSRCFLDAKKKKEAEELHQRRANEDAYVRLARLSVEHYVKNSKMAELPKDLPEEMLRRRAGAFVMLHKEGRLRACIGTTNATTSNIAEEILQNGMNACSHDPRFAPVEADELPHLKYSVDVLDDAEDIVSIGQLDVKRYGVIVSNGFRRGLLLPNLAGVETVEQQLAIALRRAGIGAEEHVRLQRFEVVRHS